MKLSRIFIASIAILIVMSACTSVSAPAPKVQVVVPEASQTLTQSSAPTDSITVRPRETRTSAPPPLSTATRTPALPTPTVTPPAPNPAYPLLTVRLQAVQVSDDDGGRAVRITQQQVGLWVDKANEIFAHASVRFLYDPGSDFAALKSTLLNDMTGDADANWMREVDSGNRVAARYPDKVVVFFIHGPEQGPTGGGFSSSNYDFVEMPGFNDTTVCGYQNIGILAHEVGHYFGLAHPFAQEFASLQDAESYLTSHGNDPSVFDGDGLSDTPPDPFIRVPQFQCNPKESITLNGRMFLLPRLNVMSYYSTTGVDRTELTAQQSAIVRWVLGVRAKNGMATPTNTGVAGAVEFAKMPIKNKADASCDVQDMSNFGDTPRWSGGKQLFCSAQLNSTIDFSISAGAAGKYGLDLYATTAPDFGKIQTLIDGNPLGTPIDLYAPIVLPSGRISIGTIDLSAATHTLSFRVVGKNLASTNYSIGLNAFTLTPEQK